MALPADVCMPSNQDFPDPFETSGRFSVDQIYWIRFLEIQMFFGTVRVGKKNQQKLSFIQWLCLTVLLLFSTKC